VLVRLKKIKEFNNCVSVKGSQYIGKNGDTIQMLGDKQGALALAKNPHLHERSMHMDICYHFIRDLAEKGKVVTSYINTVDMVANGMAKHTGRVVFEQFKNLLGLTEC
jgi:pyruvate carboxylase